MLMTGEQYIESLREMKTRVYMFGEKIDNWVDHPIIRPSINCVKVTYDLAQDPEYADLMTVKSNLTGETVNRFAHLHQSTEDLKNKVKMQRLCGQKTGSCFQRCVGMDAFNATFSTTYEIDQKYGTHYHENFVNFLKMVQEKDLVVDGAMTDPKGELYYDTAGYLMDNGYKVRRLDFKNLEKSDGWDCLKTLRGKDMRTKVQMTSRRAKRISALFITCCRIQAVTSFLQPCSIKTASQKRKCRVCRRTLFIHRVLKTCAQTSLRTLQTAFSSSRMTFCAMSFQPMTST